VINLVKQCNISPKYILNSEQIIAGKKKKKKCLMYDKSF
jgi:hypothetical protein